MQPKKPAQKPSQSAAKPTSAGAKPATKPASGYSASHPSTFKK